MQRLALVFSKNLVPELIEEYREALMAYRIEQIEAACESCRHEEKFFPKPVIITEYIRAMPINNSTMIEDQSSSPTPDSQHFGGLCCRYVINNISDKKESTESGMYQYVIDHWHDNKPHDVSDKPIIPRQV